MILARKKFYGYEDGHCRKRSPLPEKQENASLNPTFRCSLQFQNEYENVFLAIVLR